MDFGTTTMTLPPELKKSESILRDRFVHYTILAQDGEHIYTCTDSKTVAYGMMERIAGKIRQAWADEEEENDARL